jgi:hypothetical protein
MKGFGFRLTRRFDPEEIDAASYLWYQPMGYANEAIRPIPGRGGKDRTENGDLILDPRWGEDEHGLWKRRLIDVWHARSDGFILRRAALTAFDPAKFAPVEMRPVFLEGGYRPIAEMMEVRPVIELPPLAPGTVVRMPYPGRNEPVGDPGPGALCQEGFEDFIPFYRREEFEAIGPVHFARTREFQYLTDPDARRAVVSQKFRRFIDANAGPADIGWVPVMLVD